MDPILKHPAQSTEPSPAQVVRALRRVMSARFVGVGTFLAGTVGMPLLLACSCPSWTARYVHPVAPERMMQHAELEGDELCEAFCGRGALSCEFAYMASIDPDRVTPQEQERRSMDPELRSGPPGSNVVMCEVKETQPCSIGRRPEGLVARHESRTRSVLGAHFSTVAHLESAAVVAFVQLATELEVHGAPAYLVRAAEKAAVEEVRHARLTTRLARRYGATAPGPRVHVPPPRTLATVLRENALEGGVQEAFGARVAAHQAKHAKDAAVRAVMVPIAREEATHATLASLIDAWGRPLLTRSGRRAQQDAVGEAELRLRTSNESEPDETLARAAGLPSATRTRSIAETV